MYNFRFCYEFVCDLGLAVLGISFACGLAAPGLALVCFLGFVGV